MSSSPQILRPKPRRPYEQNSDSRQPPSPLLSPADAANGPSETPSRTHSILNLTSSTLLGIYSPTGYNDRYDLNEPSTPWGTGAETPSITYNPSSNPLSLSQLSPRLRRKSVAPQYTPQPKNNTLGDALNLGFRSVLLFGMGMGYGLLVRHLHDDRQLAPFQVEGIIKPRNDWRYLVFWGIAGVALGSLLPWVDTLFQSDVWVEDEFVGGEGTGSDGEDQQELDSNGIFDADWTPVVRSVGAFVGIAFAIRKLPWASTLQASLTLALVNPVLWYLVDRSKPGFILSTAVGCTGTALLLVSNPDMMPSPASHPSKNSTVQHTEIFGDIGGMGLGGYISRESVEGGIWIMSVLFCSCVCFGNIGRRLALSRGKREKSFVSRTMGNGVTQKGSQGR